MNILDAGVMILVFYGIYKGFAKGIVYMVLSTAGFILGIILSVKFAFLLVPYLAHYFNLPEVQLKWLAYLLIFLGVLLVMLLLSKLLSKLLKISGLGWLNRLSGALVSGLKYLFFTGLILMLIDEIQQRFPVFPDTLLKESKLMQPVTESTWAVIHWIDNKAYWEQIKTEMDGNKARNQKEN